MPTLIAPNDFNHLTMIKSTLKLMKSGRKGQIKIGYVGSVMHSLLPQVLALLKDRYPQINTVLLELTNERQIASLQRGEIDIGFVRTPLKVTGITTIPIYSDTFSLVLPLSHPLSKKKKLSLKELEDEPFISLTRQSAPGIYDKTISICNNYNISPIILHEATQMDSVLRLVESNLGYSIVPTCLRNSYNLKLRFFNLSKSRERLELSIAYDPSNITPLSTSIIKLITGL